MSILARLALLLALLALSPAAACAAPHVGFEQVRLPDGTEAGIWYPTDAEPSPHPLELFTQEVAAGAPVAGTGHPLIVISHGSGSSLAGHNDTAHALAAAGFVAAALTQPGDNWRDPSRATDLAARPRALRVLVDYLLSQWRGAAAIDAKRIGAFGFSAGGFTVLVAAGGTPDLARIGPHCAAHPRYFDCMLIAAHPQGQAGAPPQWLPDPRIRAIAVAAPALGFAFGRDGLAKLRVPVQLWRAAEDRVLPHPDYAEAVRIALPRPPEYHEVAGAGHFDFLAPCPPALAAAAPQICASAPGFDRAAFHAEFNAALIAFFRRTLR